jgi:RNA polymerase sigma-70 factor (ECF subfamily)
MGAASTPAREDLLRHGAWLRTLALQLARDEAEADDVVQQTWLRALETPPDRAPRGTGWWVRVVRNVVFERARRRGALRRREQRAARPERLESTVDVVIRTEMHRHLVDALLAIEEPFRSTLLLRWFDELSAAEIGRRTGVPAATVRTRLKRGMDRLRERMDARQGSRRAWVPALLALARGPEPASGVTAAGWTSGALAMGTKGKAAIAVAAVASLVLGTIAVVSRGTASRAPSTAESAAPESDAPRLAGRPEGLESASAGGAIEGDAPAVRALRGRVLDRQGRAAPRAVVTLHREGTGHVEVAVDAEGRYEASGLDPGSYVVRAHARNEGAAKAVVTIAEASREMLVPPLRLSGDGVIEGRATFPDGTPGAHVRVSAVRVEAPSGVGEDVAGLEETWTRTDASGWFRLAGLAPGIHSVSAGGGSKTSICATGDRCDLLLERRRVLLRVMDARGVPVAGAAVSVHVEHPGSRRDPRNVDGMSGEMPEDGMEDLWGDVGDRMLLSASSEDGVPAEAVLTLDDRAWSREVALALEDARPRTGTVRVRALSPSGEPLARVPVEVATVATDRWIAGRDDAAPDDAIEVPVGRWRVRAGTDLFTLDFALPGEAEVDVEEGRTTDVEIRLRPAGRLRLVVHGLEAGERSEGDRVTVTPQDGSDAYVLYAFILIEDGGWRTGGVEPGRPAISLQRFPPGVYDVAVEMVGYEPVRRAVRVEPGAYADLDVTVERASSAPPVQNR